MKNISISRIKDQIDALRLIGLDETGGTTRLSYSPEYINGQALVREYMEEAGMTVRLDGAGNLVGTYAGSEAQLAPVMTGSHLDTVPGGGPLDGALGIIAAIECIACWHRSGWRPQRTVEVVAMIEEEGTRFGVTCFGSRAMTGEFSGLAGKEIADIRGQTLPELLAGMGLDREIAIREEDDPRRLHAFVELHVEQGAELEEADLPVGIVTAIVGIERFEVTIRGEANHAGTTGMNRRKDALVAAADLIRFVHDSARSAGGEYVATVGRLEVKPNAENVVPGEVRLTVEIRAADKAIIDEVRRRVLQFCSDHEIQSEIRMEAAKFTQVMPTKLHEGLVNCCTQAAEKLGLGYRKMPSWAGHDAMILAKHVPAAMIFVPSIGGISHSPAEASDWETVEKGVQVLQSVLERVSSEGSLT